MASLFGKTRDFLAGLLPGRSQISDYDATDDKKRRRPPRVNLLSEDKHLDATGRRKLVATARNIQRNYEVAAWMIRKHLDYVSSFEFQARTGVDAVDARVEDLMTWWSRPLNFDVAGKHGRRRFTRLAEARRTLDGDFFAMKLASGQVQAIEGDRIRTPIRGAAAGAPSDLEHGVQLGPGGRPLAYALNNRDGFGFAFERMIRAGNLVPLGYYDRFDQSRGISPLATAINRLQDLYEGLDLALAKAKVTQLFALAIFSKRMDAEGEVITSDGGTDADSDGTPDEGTEKYTVDFGRGPIKLELEPGDEAQFLESKSPSTEFQSFSQLCIAIALLSLDIPYTFFDCTKANYSAARQDLLLYDQSAREKRADVREFLDVLTVWRLSLWMADGILVLPPGMTIVDLKWDWVPTGLPWIDPLKEVQADGEAVLRGFTSTARVCKEHGVDAYELVDEEAAYQAYRQERLGKYLAQMAPVKAVVNQPGNGGDNAA